MIIIGAGAAGLIAAILLARHGREVTLLEQNNKIGKKILVSGNGKCNIGNRYIAPLHYHSENPTFVQDVLQGYGFEKIGAFFDSVGLPLVEGKEGQMFPMSLRADSVAEILEYEAKQAGAKIICNCAVESISKEEEAFVLKTTMGVQKCAQLLMASGSPAAPQLGGNESGLLLALSLGHTLIPAYPSLVQLCSEEKWVRQASGVKIEGVARLYANGEHITEKKGDLLFTSYGISGLAILDISREVTFRLAEAAYCELSLDIMPYFSKEKLAGFLLGRIHKGSRKPLRIWLQGILNKKLIGIVLEQSGTKATIECELNRKEIGKLVFALKNLKLTINGSKGFKGAEVSTGGVDTTEIDPFTMESRLVKNLYLAGEILDVDGDRGGFNFHFAWTSGMRAARAIIDLLED